MGKWLKLTGASDGSTIILLFGKRGAFRVEISEGITSCVIRENSHNTTGILVKETPEQIYDMLMEEEKND
jgi:hypothetical protein